MSTFFFIFGCLSSDVGEYGPLRWDAQACERFGSGHFPIRLHAPLAHGHSAVRKVSFRKEGRSQWADATLAQVPRAAAYHRTSPRGPSSHPNTPPPTSRFSPPSPTVPHTT